MLDNLTHTCTHILLKFPTLWILESHFLILYNENNIFIVTVIIVIGYDLDSIGKNTL